MKANGVMINKKELAKKNEQTAYNMKANINKAKNKEQVKLFGQIQISILVNLKIIISKVFLTYYLNI